MMPNPIARNAIEPTEKSIRFFIMMLTAFFARVNPDSTMAKPACMKKTRNAATRVHTKSRFFCTSAGVGPAGAGAVASFASAGAAAPIARSRAARNRRVIGHFPVVNRFIVLLLSCPPPGRDPELIVVRCRRDIARNQNAKDKEAPKNVALSSSTASRSLLSRTWEKLTNGATDRCSSMGMASSAVRSRSTKPEL